eukprot:TRINITY_DN66858_c0_g1_i1.p1 TRINITY_DN66858_c0_g1~~TRINITY_DN66858_c0_g1_i1.p1  ORF type:complete len:284 (+),score=56.81 TRINITY_DN66858_c0_g1_i1:53-853(+)
MGNAPCCGTRGGDQPLVLADKAAVAAQVCKQVRAIAKEAIASDKQRFVLAVAGGSCLDSLARLTEDREVDWSKATLMFVNHKCIPPTDPKSTCYKAEKFASPFGRVMKPKEAPASGTDGSAEAKFYQELLEAENILEDIDCAVMGMGIDGHIGSLHPWSKALDCTKVAVVNSPKAGQPASITLTLPAINKAKNVFVVVVGGAGGKTEAVARATGAKGLPEEFPVYGLEAPMFILDRAAAGKDGGTELKKDDDRISVASGASRDSAR